MNEDDKFLDEYLMGRTFISRLYNKLKTEKFPEDLSEKVLSESRKAVQSKPALVKKKHNIFSYTPLALAASVLLAIGVFTFLPQETDYVDPTDDGPTFTFRGTEDGYSSPEEWVDAINILVNEGDLEGARKLYEKFKVEYPNESLQLQEIFNDN